MRGKVYEKYITEHPKKSGELVIANSIFNALLVVNGLEDAQSSFEGCAVAGGNVHCWLRCGMALENEMDADP